MAMVTKDDSEQRCKASHVKNPNTKKQQKTQQKNAVRFRRHQNQTNAIRIRRRQRQQRRHNRNIELNRFTARE